MHYKMLLTRSIRTSVRVMFHKQVINIKTMQFGAILRITLIALMSCVLLSKLCRMVWAPYARLDLAELRLPYAAVTMQQDRARLVIHRADQPRQPLLTSELGAHYTLNHLDWKECDMSNSEQEICIEWKDTARLEVVFDETNADAQCYTVRWQSLSSRFEPMDCLSVEGAHWYGGAQIGQQMWPINNVRLDLQPFICQNPGYDLRKYSGVLERYWLSSAGVAFSVPHHIPLHVGNDQKQFCLKAKNTESPFQNQAKKYPKLEYDVCIKDDVKSIHKYMSFRLWRKPLAIPNENIFRYPIWSTWAQYKMDIDEKKVLNYVHQIHGNGFPASHIEIDDMYTPRYGEFAFDPVKFPDPKALTNEIHSLGYKVSTWVIPFADPDSKAYRDGKKYGYWVREVAGPEPVWVDWWQGKGALLDVTNPAAITWLHKRLQNLRKAGVDSFKFDAGEFNYLSHTTFKTNRPLSTNPSAFCTAYAEGVASRGDDRIEVRVGYRTQHLPIFVRMYDKNSEWGFNGGLRTLIPTALQFSILGYHFILPDMIGGNAYPEEQDRLQGGALPDKELYIRWLQITAFLPVMQFSIPPWDYDAETVAIAKRYIKLHEFYVFRTLLALAWESTGSGEPLIRPLWWVDPSNEQTYDIDDQFLVGDNLMVAPIVDKGHTNRDIYIPKGKWNDKLKNYRHLGPKVIHNYEIKLEDIAYFERVIN